MDTKTVTIPAVPEHNGFYAATVTLEWKCPACGGPRGEVTKVLSYDGSRRMTCDGWKNPCGHVDKYTSVIREATTNGLNRKSAQSTAHGRIANY